jgi:hypothetical protein
VITKSHLSAVQAYECPAHIIAAVGSSAPDFDILTSDDTAGTGERLDKANISRLVRLFSVQDDL